MLMNRSEMVNSVVQGKYLTQSESLGFVALRVGVAQVGFEMSIKRSQSRILKYQ